MNVLKSILFRWLIFFKGIRFYETTYIPKSPGFRSISFETVGDEKVEFYFYRDECEDLIYRRGQFRKEKFIGYVIQAQFPENLPSRLHRFNNLKFFFNSKSFAADNEEDAVRRLLNIYIELLTMELKRQ